MHLSVPEATDESVLKMYTPRDGCEENKKKEDERPHGVVFETNQTSRLISDPSASNCIHVQEVIAVIFTLVAGK